jgi:hypothetical protein
MAVNFRVPYEGRYDGFFDICKKDLPDEISWLLSQLAQFTNVLSYNILPPKTLQVAKFNLHTTKTLSFIDMSSYMKI